MWSGNMSNQGEPFSSQMVGSWALNPNMPYMNVPHEQVDWASLAQQWIKMKEEVPQYDKEGGEAPMDIIKEDSTVTTSSNPPEWPANTTDGTWSGNWSWNQAGGGWCWSSVTPHVSKPAVPSTFTPTYPAISDVSTPIISQPAAFPYTPPQAPSTNDSFPPNHTYWTGTTSEGKDSSWDSHRVHKKHTNIEQTPELDAAKRKQLPAWIREGLEKMERDKLKKAENERLEKLRKDEIARQSELPSIDSNGLAEQPAKSKFETDSEESDHGAEIVDKKIKSEEKPRRSRFDWHESALSAPPLPKFHSKEQILQSVMVDVRKILTQILMEVTTEELQKVVDEEIRHFKRKAPATTVRKTAALTSLTGKLGLGIYESDSDSESEPEEKVKNDPDSDQELRERIEKLKNEFVNVEKAIEIEAAEQEERERKQLRYVSLNKEGSPNNHEEQVQPLREDSPASNDKMRSEEHIKEISDQKRINRLSESNKSESNKESNSNSTSYVNINNKSSKKLVNERSYRRSSSSYSSSIESSSSSSSSSRSSNSRYKRRASGRRSGTDRRSSRYSRSRSRSRSRSHSRGRRDRSRHGSECRRRTRRRSSRDRKGRSRRSSSTSSNGHHRSRKSNHRR